MRIKKSTNFAIYSSIILAMIIVFQVQARSAEPVEIGKMTEAKMMEFCQEMKVQKETMMAELKAQDTELTEQVARMNSSPENKKMELMAAVVTNMVKQRTAVNTRMEKMQKKIMGHMMQHMQMSKESILHCPMMKGISAPSTASGAEGVFLQAMLPHHEMAIEMARMAAQKAKNPIIKSMANEIIRAQSDEIEKIRAIYQRLFGSKLTPNKMAHEGLGLTMEQSGMKMDMKTLEKATNFDELFVERMTIHHQGAINMARKALETTTDAEIRKLAEAIIEAQTKELETLKTIR